jgi:hypothetical protein
MHAGAARFLPATLEKAAGVRFAARPGGAPTPSDARAVSSRLLGVAKAFYRDANPETAAALLEVSLRHPHELVRVAAATSYMDVAADPARAIRILGQGLRSRDRLARDVAAHALAHVDPRNPALEKLLASKKRPSRRKPSRTSMIVHGTWAGAASWWQPPTGDFWKYLHDNVDPDLYGAQDRFEWSQAATAMPRGRWVVMTSRYGCSSTRSAGSISSRTATAGASPCWPIKPAPRSADLSC